MEWLLVVGAVAVVLVVLDRVVASGRLDPWLEARRERRREERADSGAATASGAFGEIVELFQPNREHLTAEQERQRLWIHQYGDDDPPFDLDSGEVHLTRRPRPTDDPDAS